MAEDSVGQIGLDLVVNEGSFQRQMAGIQNLARKAGAALAGAFAVKKIVDFGKQCLELGSDLTEVQNVVDVTFPHMTAQVDEFAKKAIHSFGLSETMAKQYSGTYGAMAKAFGFTEKAAYDMGTTLAGLSGDVASFYNRSQDEAYTKLKSVFTGETESLKDLGVVMTQTALDSYALANGFGKTTSAMTEAEKVSLRYQFVQSQLSAATGDFARTSDSWANQCRILSLQIQSTMATVGQGLINLFTPIIKIVNVVIGKIATLANAFKAFTELITGNKSSGSSSISAPVSDLGSAADTATGGLSDASNAANGLSDSTNGVGKAAKKAAKEMRSLMGFDSINKLTEQTDSSGEGSSGGGAPSGGGSSLGSAVDFGNLAKGDTEVDKMDKRLQALIERCKELAALFKKGFQIGFGDSEKKIKSIQKSIQSIKESLLGIFMNKSVEQAADSLANSVALNLGKITGSVASIGLSITDNLFGGLERYLQQNGAGLKQKIIAIFNISSDLANLAGDIAVAVAGIFDIFTTPTAKQITADLIGLFTDGFLGVKIAGLAFVRDVASVIITPIVNNVDKIKRAFENILAPIRTVLDTLYTSLKTTFAEIGTVYNAHVKPMVDSFAAGISSLVGTVLDGFNTYIAPVLQKLAKEFDSMWRNHVQPAINSIIELVGSVADCVKSAWENVFQPLAQWIISTIIPVIAPIFEAFGTAVIEIFGKVADVVKSVTDALGTFAEWCGNNQGVIEGVTIAVTAFFAAWKTVEFMSFIQQAGGIQGAFEAVKAGAVALVGAFQSLTVAKIADAAQTVYLNLLYAKDFVVSVAQGVASLVEMAAQIAVTTAAKIADAAAQAAMTAATVVWNGVCALATTATTALGVAFNILTGPIGAVVLAIGVAIAAGVAIYKNWDTIKAKAIQIWGAIRDWFEKTINKIKEVFKGLWKGIKETFKDVGTWFKDKFTKAFNGIKEAFKTTKTFFKGVWGGIKDAFGNIADWFKGKFSAAWQAVKDVFSSGGAVFEGIKDGILDGLKAVINALIRGINSVITIPFNGINSALSGLKNISILDHQPFSWLPTISIPQIPELAQGGFVRKNTPQLAMIGDNRHQGEVVAPEDKLREMAMEAVKAAGTGGISRVELEQVINSAVMRIVSALMGMGFYVDGEQMARVQRSAAQAVDTRFNPVEVG